MGYRSSFLEHLIRPLAPKWMTKLNKAPDTHPILMNTIKKTSPELVSTDVIFPFQLPLPSTQAHSISKLLPKKGGNEKSQLFWSVRIGILLLLSSAPSQQPSEVVYQKTITLPCTGLCQETCPLQVVLPAASFLLLEGLQVCRRFVWRLTVEKRYAFISHGKKREIRSIQSVGQGHRIPVMDWGGWWMTSDSGNRAPGSSM